MVIHLTTEITVCISINALSLNYIFDPASINIECLETLGETLGSDTVPTQEPSTADSTVPNSAQKPTRDTCSDPLKNQTYIYKSLAFAAVLLTVGVGVGVWYFSGGHFPPTDFGSGSQIPLISKSVEIHTPLPEVKATLFEKLAKVETPTTLVKANLSNNVAFLPEDTLGITSKKKQPTYTASPGSENPFLKDLLEASVYIGKNN